jgi:isopentenyl-diphosphate delta-isomerase
MQERHLSADALRTEQDPTASERKKDHIEMAFQSQVDRGELDSRFFYEPLLSAHPSPGSWPETPFLGKTLKVPLWVSSMTGGTALARTINFNLARACGEFGMGMGLGSCRQLLYNDTYLADFDVRHLMGDDLPLYTNLGIAQLEQLLDTGAINRINELVGKLRADGLIIHVNPFQEWLQPEGDRFQRPPLETIQAVLEYARFPVIVKEVGQGMGKESLRALMQLPLAAIDFAAAGGTNFSRLELLRAQADKAELYDALAQVGHTASEMTDMVNALGAELGNYQRCQAFIVSGGIKNFLDGYYCISKLAFSAVYGQASGFLTHARGDYADLRNYLQRQIEGLELARAFLRPR